MTTNNSEPDYKYILFDSPEAKRKQDRARAHIYDKDRVVPAYERDAKKFTPPKFRRGDILVLFAPLSVLSAKGFDGIIGSSVGSPADNSSRADNTRQGSDVYVAISNLKVASVSDPSTTLGEYLYTMETTGNSVGEAFILEGLGGNRGRNGMGETGIDTNLAAESSKLIWSCMGVRFVFKLQCSIVLHDVEIISTDDYLAIKGNSPVWQIENPDKALIAGRKIDFVAENVLPSSMSGEQLCMSGVVVYDPRVYDGDLKYRTKVMLNIGFDSMRNRPSSKNKNSINNLLFNRRDTMSNIYKHIHPTGASLSPSGSSEIRIVNSNPSGR